MLGYPKLSMNDSSYSLFGSNSGIDLHSLLFNPSTSSSPSPFQSVIGTQPSNSINNNNNINASSITPRSLATTSDGAVLPPPGFNKSLSARSSPTDFNHNINKNNNNTNEISTSISPPPPKLVSDRKLLSISLPPRVPINDTDSTTPDSASSSSCSSSSVSSVLSAYTMKNRVSLSNPSSRKTSLSSNGSSCASSPSLVAIGSMVPIGVRLIDEVQTLLPPSVNTNGSNSSANQTAGAFSIRTLSNPKPLALRNISSIEERRPSLTKQTIKLL
jgi:hypothetical protein